MRRIVKGEIYSHRGYFITKDNQGICVENHLEIFPTFTDGRRFIDKILDGTQDKEPKIIGEWDTDKAIG